MNRPFAVIALLAACAAAPLPLAAQGKIDEVERNARDDENRGDDDGDGGLWGLQLFGDVFKGIFLAPKGPGQGYLPYPYGGGAARESFVLQDVQGGRRFGNLSVGLFNDASSSLASTMFAFEGANAGLRYTLELGLYREAKATETDHLTDFRAGLGAAVPAGRAGYVPVEVAARAVCLDTGRCAGGADFAVGARLFPSRPLGLSGELRIGAMSWSGGSSFLLTESNVAASLFLGRMEVSAGWHWLKLGPAAAFAGPTVSTRFWF